MVRASIEVRARIDEALRRWSEFSALADGSGTRARPQSFVSGCVDFEPVAGSRSRITLRLEQRGAVPEPASTRRALEDHLVAFKGFVDESGLPRCANARW